MEPGFIPGAEAQRWLIIAERLLSSRDLVGCKTFAIRARESDPRLEIADQILAVADTLMAGDRLVGNNQRDWYAILQLVGQTNDSELIATQYSRLALFLNPHRNRLPFADQAFRLVFDAWSVLSDPSRKSMYDNMLDFYSKLNLNPPGSTSYRAVNQEQQIPFHQQQQQNFQEQHQLLQQHQPLPQQRQQQMPPQQQQLPQQHQPSPKQPQKQQGERYQHKLSHPEPQPRQSPQKNDTHVPPSVQQENATEESSVDQSPTFWTACPYCYHMYEYPKVYLECTLRCQNCRRASQAVKVPSPSQIPDEQDAYFYCWGYFPIGISESNLRKVNGGESGWAPFSTPFGCSQEMMKNFELPKRVNARKRSTPRTYIDDDYAFIESSESSDGSDDDDDDWGSEIIKKKRVKSEKRRGRPPKSVKKSQEDKENNDKEGGGSDLDVQSRVEEQKGLRASSVSKAESSNKVTASTGKRPMGKAAKEWGRLDLNVEFSNETEEPARRATAVNRAGNREDDNIEGTGFFEGLDEFLSSLPILSVVNDKFAQPKKRTNKETELGVENLLSVFFCC